MTNLTLAIDESVLRRARIRAVQEDTTVNAEVRDFLIAYANHCDTERRRQAMARFLEVVNSVPSGGGFNDRTWVRDDLYER
ncbi:MAG: hypothetical protein FWD55_08345 [Propionibacteriaceae bacterium]|nr:hypothetical protein [Propionibacteriaceae bacterium]